MPFSIQRLAREILDVIDQLVRRGRSRLDLFLRNRIRDRGVQLGGKRQIRNLLVVLIPEPARQRVHQSHGPPGEFVAGSGRDQDVEALVEPHEGDIVGLGGGREHGFRHLGEFAAFLRSGALGRQARHQALQLAPHLEQPQLQPQIDLGHHDAAPGHDHDKPVPRQPLQGFADRGAADLQANRKRLFRQHRSRR